MGEENPARTLSGPARVGAAAQVFVDDLEALAVDEDDARHLVRSLRLRPGEVVVAADGGGRWRRTRVSHAGGRHLAEAADVGTRLLEPDGPVVLDDGPPPSVTVGFVPVKGERPEWVVQKLTEIGVDGIVVLCSARSVVRWDDERGARTLERLRRVVRAAAAQSRRTRLPELRGIWSPARMAEALNPEPLALADPFGGQLPEEVRALAVGPEGGWDDTERSTGAVRVSLGPQVLRAETAAVVAGALLCALRDGRMRRP